MWHKQSFTQFWSQSDAYSRRSSLKLTYIHHPLVVCTHQICCAVAVPIALSQDRLLHGHNRLVNWTPCSRRRESKLKSYGSFMPLCNHVCGLKNFKGKNDQEELSRWWPNLQDICIYVLYTWEKNEKVIKNYVFTSITMFVDLENFRFSQLWVRRDGVGTPHPNPSTPKLFRSNLNIVVNISCKFQDCWNI